MRAQCDSFSQMNYSVNGNHLNTFSLIRCLFLAHLFAVVYMVHSNAINPLLITQFILMFLFLLRAFLQSFCYIFLFPFFWGLCRFLSICYRFASYVFVVLLFQLYLHPLALFSLSFTLSLSLSLALCQFTSFRPTASLHVQLSPLHLKWNVQRHFEFLVQPGYNLYITTYSFVLSNIQWNYSYRQLFKCCSTLQIKKKSQKPAQGEKQ